MSKRKASFEDDTRQKCKIKKLARKEEIIDQPRFHGQLQCVECFQSGKMKQAAFADKKGQKYRLCTEHARIAGTFLVISPCVDCPIKKKKQGIFPDANGKKKQLCTAHAKKRGVYAAACTQLSNASWEKSIQNGKVKIQIDKNTKTKVVLFRCSGVNRKQHYVKLDDIGKTGVGKHGVSDQCKKCHTNKCTEHTDPKRTLSRLYTNMSPTTKKRQKRFPAMKNVSWANKQIFINFVKSALALTDGCYQIPNTIVGTISFPITLISGYHNTVSIDRIDDNEGYVPSNVEIRPHFLNSPLALQSEHLRMIVKQRIQPRTQKEIEFVVSQLIDATTVTTGKFYNMAKNSKSSMSTGRRKARGLCYRGGNLLAFVWHLAIVFMRLGGRCDYTGAKLLLGFKQGPMMISLERVNSDAHYDYNEKQTTLILAGLNCVHVGQRHSRLTAEERAKALLNGSFNQKYWNKSTKITLEVQKAIDHAREADRIRLQALFKVNKETLKQIVAAKTSQ